VGCGCVCESVARSHALTSSAVSGSLPVAVIALSAARLMRPCARYLRRSTCRFAHHPAMDGVHCTGSARCRASVQCPYLHAGCLAGWLACLLCRALRTTYLLFAWLSSVIPVPLLILPGL
jgi:hypothetical protein